MSEERKHCLNIEYSGAVVRCLKDRRREESYFVELIFMTEREIIGIEMHNKRMLQIRPPRRRPTNRQPTVCCLVDLSMHKPQIQKWDYLVSFECHANVAGCREMRGRDRMWTEFNGTVLSVMTD